MLVKRKTTGWRPPNKMRATRNRMYKRGNRTSFAGVGYNPKAVPIRRKAPPGAEKKFHEIGQDATTLASVATGPIPAHSGFASFNLIANGDTMSTRNGNKITIDSINIRGRCLMDANADVDPANVLSGTTVWRVVLYLDTQCNGGAPTFDEYFDNQLIFQDAFDVYNSLHQTGRFKTLMDKRITVVSQPAFIDTSTTPDRCFCFGGETEFSHTIKNLHIPVYYSDNTANLQAVRTNNIGMWVMSVGGLGATTVSQRKFAYRVRVRFYDY